MKLKTIEILDIPISTIRLKQATELIIQWSQNRDQKHVITPNPEILIESTNNPKFKGILKNSSLNTADGIGILWAAKYKKIIKKNKSKLWKLIKCFFSLIRMSFSHKYVKDEISERVTGADMLIEICRHCPKLKSKIFLLGASEGVAEKVKKKLTKRFKGLKIVKTFAGTPLKKDQDQIVSLINASKANILFVAYGAPKQEVWIKENLHKIPLVKVAIGIGGAFDFVAKKKKRAPKWLRKIGLEWLYRLIQEPSRIKRIYNATIKFPYLVWRNN